MSDLYTADQRAQALEDWLSQVGSLPAQALLRIGWERAHAEYGDDARAMREARGAAVAVARAHSMRGGADHGGVLAATATTSARLANAKRDVELATARAKTQAAMLLESGSSEVAVAALLGVPRMTIRRWFGKGTR